VEHHKANLKPLSVAFLDIRKALDSIYRSSLQLTWKAWESREFYNDMLKICMTTHRLY